MSKNENGHRQTVVEVVEVLDIEEFSKGGDSDRRPPKACVLLSSHQRFQQ